MGSMSKRDNRWKTVMRMAPWIGISVLLVFFAGGAVLLSRVEPKRD